MIQKAFSAWEKQTKELFVQVVQKWPHVCWQRPAFCPTFEHNNIGKYRAFTTCDFKTLRELESDLGIPKICTSRILTENLGMNCVCAKFIPKLLTVEQKSTAEKNTSKSEQCQVHVDCFLRLWRCCTSWICFKRLDDQQRILPSTSEEIACCSEKKTAVLLTDNDFQNSFRMWKHRSERVV